MAGNPNWRKGVSGNPGGRVGIPKDIREAAQRYCAAAIETLAEIARDKCAHTAAFSSARERVVVDLMTNSASDGRGGSAAPSRSASP